MRLWGKNRSKSAKNRDPPIANMERLKSFYYDKQAQVSHAFSLHRRKKTLREHAEP